MAKPAAGQMALGRLKHGLVASIEAADAMVKAASVSIVGHTKAVWLITTSCVAKPVP